VDAGPGDDGWFEDKVGNKRKKYVPRPCPFPTPISPPLKPLSKTSEKPTTLKKQKPSAFPSGYTFATPQEDEAKRRRTERFEREREIEESKNANQLKGFIPRQVHGGALEVPEGGGVGRTAGRGKWMGRSDAVVDPVCFATRDPLLELILLAERDQLGSIYHPRNKHQYRKTVPPSYKCMFPSLFFLNVT
jgi:hypothetical protein